MIGHEPAKEALASQSLSVPNIQHSTLRQRAGVATQ
jgi:hypothetical protein